MLYYDIPEVSNMNHANFDKDYNNRELSNTHKQLLLKNRTFLFINTILTLALIATATYTFLLRKKRREDMREKLLFIEKLKSESLQRINSLSKELSVINSNESKLKELLDRKLEVIRKLIDIYYRYGSSPNAFLANFKSVIKIDKLDVVVFNDLAEIVNAKYKGVINNLKKIIPI